MDAEPLDDFELFRTQSLMGGRDVERGWVGDRVQQPTRSYTEPRHRSPRLRRRDRDNNNSNNDVIGSDFLRNNGDNVVRNSASSSRASDHFQRFRASSLCCDDSHVESDDKSTLALVRTSIACQRSPVRARTYTTYNTESENCQLQDSVIVGAVNYAEAIHENTMTFDFTSRTMLLDVGEDGDQRLLRTYSDKHPPQAPSTSDRKLNHNDTSEDDNVVDGSESRSKRTQTFSGNLLEPHNPRLQQFRYRHQFKSTELVADCNNDETGIEGEDVGMHLEVFRVRSFSTRSGEIVNRGDSFKLRSSPNHASNYGLPWLPSSSESNIAALAGNTENQPIRQQLHQQQSTAGRKPDSFFIASGGSNQKPVIPTVFITSGDDTISPVQESTFADSNNEGEQEDIMNDDGGREEEETEQLLQQRGISDNFYLPQIQRTACYHVIVVGAAQVGKTALRHQLMTSEYLANSYSNENYLGRKSVFDVAYFLNLQCQLTTKICTFICNSSIMDPYVFIFIQMDL
jgi:hypothetical protein